MLAISYDPNDKAGLEKMRKGAGKLYGAAFLACLAAALVLGKIVVATTVITAPYGMKVDSPCGWAFVATAPLTDTLFGPKPLKLFLVIIIIITGSLRATFGLFSGDGSDPGSEPAALGGVSRRRQSAGLPSTPPAGESCGRCTNA